MPSKIPQVILAGVGQTSEFSLALLKTFVKEGYGVTAVNRQKKSAEALCLKIPKEMHSKISFVQADLTKEAEIKKVADDIQSGLGPVSVLIYNASSFLRKGFLETDQQSFRQLWENSCLGAVVCAQAILPSMLKNKKGTLIFTGATASLRGGAKFSGFCSAKFALRGLAQSLAREFSSQGIHVVHSIIDGIIWGEAAQKIHLLSKEQCVDPMALADQYMRLINQSPTCWTHELDIRPAVEKF